MLWDMARYQNYDIRSPYNREAALWAAHQTTFRFPIDTRPLRDRREALGRSTLDDDIVIKSDPTPRPIAGRAKRRRTSAARHGD